MSTARGSVYRRGATFTAHVTWKQDGRWRQRKQGGFRRRGDAQEALTMLLHGIDRGLALPPNALTVDGYLAGWLDHLEHVVGRKPSTIASYRAKVRQYVSPTVGDVRLQKLTAADLNRLYSTMARRGLSARTIRYVHSIVRKAMADAEDEGLVERNVATRAKPPTSRAARAPRFTVWSDEQLGAFLDFAEGRQQYEAILFAASTGARRGEVCALRWSDLDLDAKPPTAVLRHSVVQVAGQGVVEGDTKTHRDRPITLDAELVAVLREHRRRQIEWRLVVGQGWRDHDLVFCGPAGDYLKPDSLSQAFDRLVAASGLPRIRFHDLRHGHATSLATSTDPALVAQRLGHATTQFTFDHYVKTSLDRQAEAADRVAARIPRRKQR